MNAPRETKVAQEGQQTVKIHTATINAQIAKDGHRADVCITWDDTGVEVTAPLQSNLELSLIANKIGEAVKNLFAEIECTGGTEL